MVSHLKYDEVSLEQESSSRHHLNSKTTCNWFKQYQMIPKLYLIDSNITLHNKLRYHKKNCTELLRGKWRVRIEAVLKLLGDRLKAPWSVERWRWAHATLMTRSLFGENWRKSGELKIYEHELRAMAKRYLSLKFC